MDVLLCMYRAAEPLISVLRSIVVVSAFVYMPAVLPAIVLSLTMFPV